MEWLFIFSDLLRKEQKETEKTLGEVINKSKQGTNSLNKIASKESEVLSTSGYIDVIIHEELREGTPGWMERIQILQKMKGKVTVGLKGLTTKNHKTVNK